MQLGYGGAEVKVLLTTPTIDNITIFKYFDRRAIHLKDISSKDDLLYLCNNVEYQVGFEWPNVALLFIKENIPSIDILDYPTMEEYRNTIENGNYDAVAFSFYTISVDKIVEMAGMARECGVKEIWAGNYGATTPGYERYFDRIFKGHGEALLKPIIEGKELTYRRHPIILGHWGFLSMKKKIGFLYTLTGCRYRCKFCPTTNYIGDVLYFPIEEVYRVIDEYYKMGVEHVMIMDENFLQDWEHSHKTIMKLQERDMTWQCLARVDNIKGRVRELKKLGFRSAELGIESLNSSTLKEYKGGAFKIKDIIELFDELQDNGLTVVMSYILGYPSDTEESFLDAVDIIKNLKASFCTVFTALTPYCNTNLVDLEEKIVDRDPRHYDGYHLVFRHPHLEPEQVRNLFWKAHESTIHPLNSKKKRIIERWRELKEND